MIKVGQVRFYRIISNTEFENLDEKPGYNEISKLLIRTLFHIPFCYVS